jgi:CubicO group peptidase (beta-lactamase class C family)
MRALFAALLVALCGAPAMAQSADALVGLWSMRLEKPAALHGELRLTRAGGRWQAAISGHRATGRAVDGELRFSFTPNLGQFRGRRMGQLVEGYWLQPANWPPDPADPGGAGQAFASKITLAPAGRDAWAGDVRPLPNRFTLWLKVFRGEDGTLTAAFRNPEQGSTGGRTQFLVSRSGDSVLFASRPAQGAAPVAHRAVLMGERLRLFWPDLGRPVVLARRTPAEAAAFFPRPPGEPPYHYRAPATASDGWTTGRASAVGIDEAALERVVQRQIDSDPTDRRPSLMHSILVARRGRLVLEEYFFGYDRETPHDIRSAGKTFAAVMMGAVRLRDPAFGPELRAYELLAARGPFANPDPRKARITLGQLMTHTSGLACDDNDADSPGEEGRMQMQAGQPDWWKYEMDLPVVHDPGTRYAYCSGVMSLMGAALTTRTRTWLPRLFDETVARPLQFGPYWWNLMPTGEGYLGGGAFLRPRDLLKVGQAYLDGGTWKGQRIADPAWIAESTRRQVEVTPATTGLSADQFGDFYAAGADGYAWHLGQLRAGERTFRTYAATGNGGQVLIVVPDADLVVVFTGGNFGQGGVWGRWGDEIVGKMILPAIR